MSRDGSRPGWPARARYATELPIPRKLAWRTLAPFERGVCQDHFHREVRLHGPRPAAGVAFDLPHGFLGLQVERRGRILTTEAVTAEVLEHEDQVGTGVLGDLHELLLEVHHDPDTALSDGPQSITPEMFESLMGELRQMAPILGRTL